MQQENTNKAKQSEITNLSCLTGDTMYPNSLNHRPVERRTLHSVRGLTHQTAPISGFWLCNISRSQSSETLNTPLSQQSMCNWVIEGRSQSIVLQIDSQSIIRVYAFIRWCHPPAPNPVVARLSWFLPLKLLFLTDCLLYKVNASSFGFLC